MTIDDKIYNYTSTRTKKVTIYSIFNYSFLLKLAYEYKES